MKNIFIILFAAVFVLSSCEDFEIEDQGFSLEALPPSVAFDAAGDQTDADDSGAEGGTISLDVEVPGGTLEDITVTYSLSGTATFGTDYTIAGATAAGGTITIDHDPSDVTDFDDGTLEIVLLNDLTEDEDETIVVRLESAVNESGESIAVGRGGTDILRTATVTVADVALGLSLSASSVSRFESDTDSVEFTANLTFAAPSAVSFTLAAAGDAALAPVYSAESEVPGLVTIAAGESSASVKFALADNGAITTSPDGVDSLIFSISAPTVTGGTVDLGTDSLQVTQTDDIKEYGFSVAGDTIDVNVSDGAFVVNVVLTDTTSMAGSPAFANVDVAITLNGGSTATAGTDFIAPTTVQVPAGSTSTVFPISLASNATDGVVATFDLGAATTTDNEIIGTTANNQIIIRINNDL